MKKLLFILLVASSAFAQMNASSNQCMATQATAASLNSAVIHTVSAASTSAATPKILTAAGAASTVKASTGNLYGFSLLNNNAAVVWVEFFNTTSVTLGTTTPVAAFPIPASGALTIPPGAFALFNNATAISVAAVTSYNGSSTGSVSGTLFYN